VADYKFKKKIKKFYGLTYVLYGYGVNFNSTKM